MAKYGKNNYFDGVVLPEPKEEALRRMAKGVNCSDGGFMSAAAELNVVPCSIQCVFKPMVLTDSPQTVFAMSNSASAPRIDLHNGYITAYLGYNSIRIYDIAVDTVYDFVFVCDSDKSILYVNGNLAASFADVSRCSGYKLGYLLVNSTKYHFQGDYLLHRHFNYAMSANEVKALDNTGDPAGYIVPKSRRLQATPYIRLMAPMTTDGWSSYNAQSIPPTIVDGALAVTYPTETGQGYNNGIWRRLSVNVENECYFLLKFKAKADDDNTRIASFVGVGSGLPYYRHEVIASTSFTEYYAVFKNTRGVSMTSVGFYPIYNTSGNGKFYIKDVSVTSIGLIAEYLPHNLIPTAEGSVVKWLDSAPQLPEANGILPPLDASVGGYDLAAIGNPKIII